MKQELPEELEGAAELLQEQIEAGRERDESPIEREKAAKTDHDHNAKAEVPDNAVSISDPSEAPEGARTVTGPGGGNYYIPPGEDGDGATRPDGIRDEEEIERLDGFIPESVGARDGERVSGLASKLAESGATTEEVLQKFDDSVDDWGENEAEMKKRVAASAVGNQAVETKHGTTKIMPGPNDDYDRQAKEEFRDSVDRDTYNSVQSNFDAWHSGDMGESTAAVYQAAAEITGNEKFVDPVGGGGDPFAVDVPDEEVEAVRKAIEHTQEQLRDKFGDTVPLTRGVHGDLARDLEGGGEVSHQSAESWSLSPGFASRFASADNHPEADEDGVVMTKDVPVESIIATGDTTPGISSLGSEFVVALGDEEYGEEDVSGVDDESVANLHMRLSEKVFN